MKRELIIGAVVAVVLAACVVVYVVVRSAPEHRTTLLVDTSAPGSGFGAVAEAVEAVAHNTGSGDALALRRFGGECGAADNTAEVADEADEVPGAVRGLAPSGRATLLSGVLAAIDDYSGIYPFRGSQRNRIIVVSSTGVDACTTDPQEASRAIRERVAAAGLDLDIRIVGHQVPEDQRESLQQLVGDQAVAFTEDAAELTEQLDELVVPDSPDAARISVTTPPEPPAYAFTSATRLGVARGERVIAEAAGDFSLSGPAFTADGRFAFAASDAGLAVVDVEGGGSRVVPCGDCGSAAAVGGGRVAWTGPGRDLVVLDLGEPGARPAPALALPARRVTDPAFPSVLDLPPKVVTGGEGVALVASPDEPAVYGGPDFLYLVGLDGSVRDLGATDANVGLGSAALSPDGRTVAYAGTWHNGACQEATSVIEVDAATGAPRTAPIGELPEDGGSITRDLWYDDGGRLNAVYASWACSASGGDSTPVRPASHWRLDGGRWALVDAGPLLASRPLGDDARVVVAEPDEYLRVGTLYLESGGRRTAVATGVSAVAVAG
ncbi:hypothetical protein [Saccharothrix xinjiangensis]|uniref:VWFA domain-containing protein n=1 Tax=Saccharothrix xinjiangensis TaxID=204798 RepID=A0ABV9XS28_9PSEU